MQELKAFLITIASGIMAYLAPIADNVFAMSYLLLCNFVVGLLVAQLVNHEGFSWRKFGWCGVEAFIFFGLVASIYVVGHKQGNAEAAAQCVSMVVYAMCYFYGCRILRNLRTLLPDNSVGHSCVAFLYEMLTLELVRRIPHLQEYINKVEQAKEK